jgi:hypothetical protein
MEGNIMATNSSNPAVVLAALRVVQKRVLLGELKASNIGMCYAIEKQLPEDDGVLMSALQEDMARWPAGARCSAWPIPSSYAGRSNIWQYYSRHNKYGGKQLAYRKALLAWLITEYGG